MMRAKFKLTSITKTYASATAAQLKFSAQYDQTIPEDRSFTKYTPSGELTMTIDNPPLLEKLTLGQDYYLDFTPSVVQVAVAAA